MVSLELLKRGLRYPDLVLGAINVRYHRTKHDTRYNPDGVNIFEEDWDNLILLDACRSDYFEQECWLEGEHDSRVSRASMSKEFIRGNFEDEVHHDVVYVSANWFYPRLADELGAEIHDFRRVPHDAKDLPVPDPETTTSFALDANKTYPNKRLIVHYLIPHWPFRGESADEIVQERGMIDTIKINGLSHTEVRRLYRENVRIAISQAETLLEQFDGKTVISADHGEMLGERQSPIPVRSYGHPRGTYVPDLVDIPWFTAEFEKRKEVTAEPPVESESDLTSDGVEQNLRELGYL
jgi:hypothetical protein